jgi:hypothetical protein
MYSLSPLFVASCIRKFLPQPLVIKGLPTA